METAVYKKIRTEVAKEFKDNCNKLYYDFKNSFKNNGFVLIKKTRQQMLKYNKEYYAKHKQQLLEYQKQYYNNNKEKIKALSKIYYNNNKEKISKYYKEKYKQKRMV
jgi:hypothetical protein